MGFASAWERTSTGPPGRWADLGTGGGPPGLVLAHLWPGSRALLIESTGRRAAYLRRAVGSLGLTGAGVVQQRAEEVGRDPEVRGTLDLVVARGFGPPAVTAECAAPLLQPGGLLVVSDPPHSPPDRWPERELGELGLVPEGVVYAGATYQVLRQSEVAGTRYPRRPGIPAKRPLF